MALVQFGPEIVSIRGRLGGVYFKRGSDGQHVQAMPRRCRKANLDTPKTFGGEHKWSRAFGISAFSGMAGIWMLALATFYAAFWGAYALVYFFIDEDGDEKKISGYNWFIHYSMMFPEEYSVPFWKPPHSPGDLPHYICTYQGRWTYEHAPTEWPSYCCAGYYWPGMDWNGKPSYRTDDYEWFIWWGFTGWVLSTSLGWADPPTTFFLAGDDIRGRYHNLFQNKYAHVYFGRPQD